MSRQGPLYLDDLQIREMLEHLVNAVDALHTAVQKQHRLSLKTAREEVEKAKAAMKPKGIPISLFGEGEPE